MPNLLVVLVLALIRAVQTFDEVFVLTGGGPGTATLFIVQYIYETGFANQIQHYGLAAAASLVLGAVLFVLTLLQLRLSRNEVVARPHERPRRLPARAAAAAGRWHWTDVAAYAYLLARRGAHVRAGAVAGAVVVQDAGGAPRVPALAAADGAEGGDRAGLRQAAAAVSRHPAGRQRRASSRRCAASASSAQMVDPARPTR